MVDKGHLAGRVASTVRDWIREGTLAHDRFYSVQQIADQLGMSRSPAREGLLALAEVGLIEFHRNRGFRVVVPGGQQIAEIFAIRLAIEPSAADRAARYCSPAEVAGLVDTFETLTAVREPTRFADIDQDLHSQILAGSRNRRAQRVIDDLRDLVNILGPWTAERSRTLADIAIEHQPVVDAIAAGDSARARLSMRQHLITTGRLLISQCADGGDDDAWESWNSLVEDDV